VTEGDSWDKGPRFHHRAQLIVIEPLLGIVSNNSADSVLHVVIAVVALYLGFGMKPAATPTT